MEGRRHAVAARLAVVGAALAVSAAGVAVPRAAAAMTTCTTVAAHRGSGEGPMENTLPAIRYARWHRADVVEADARETLDHYLVMMHDSTVDRTTDGTGKVAYLTYAQIGSLTTDSGAKVPSEWEFVHHVAATPMGLLLELKKPMTTTGAVHAVRNVVTLGMGSRTVVHSFNLTLLQAVHDAFPNMPLALITTSPTGTTVDQAIAMGVQWIEVEYTGLDTSSVAALHGRGVKVAAWTVDGTAAWSALPDVDEIITNHAYYLSRYLGCGA